MTLEHTMATPEEDEFGDARLDQEMARNLDEVEKQEEEEEQGLGEGMTQEHHKKLRDGLAAIFMFSWIELGLESAIWRESESFQGKGRTLSLAVNCNSWDCQTTTESMHLNTGFCSKTLPPLSCGGGTWEGGEKGEIHCAKSCVSKLKVSRGLCKCFNSCWCQCEQNHM